MNRFNHFVLLPPRSNIDSWPPLQSLPPLQLCLQRLSRPLDGLRRGQPFSRFQVFLPVRMTASDSLTTPAASPLTDSILEGDPNWLHWNVYSFLEYPTSSFLPAFRAGVRFLFLEQSFVLKTWDYQWDQLELLIPTSSRPDLQSVRKSAELAFTGTSHWGCLSSHFSHSGFLTLWGQTKAAGGESKSLINFIVSKAGLENVSRLLSSLAENWVLSSPDLNSLWWKLEKLE